MAQKGRLKIKPVLIAINIFVLLIIISFYGIRMYKYYKSENEVMPVSASLINLLKG